MDDDLGLLPDHQAAPTPPRRPFGLLLGALVVVALLAAAGVFWMVTSIADRSGKLTVAGSASPAPATTSPPPPPTTPPVASVPPPTVVPTSPAPVRTATTVVTTSRPPAPTRKPTTAPVPAPQPVPPPRPVPRPTPTTPVGTLVLVPDVVGLRVQLASTVLRQAGFAVQVIGGVQDPGRDDRRITAERPTAGTAVRPGSTVILVTDGT